MRTFTLLLAIWLTACSDKTTPNETPPDLSDRTLKLVSTDTPAKIDRNNSWGDFKAKYSFSDFPSKLYAGELAEPDFNSLGFRNKDYLTEYISEQIKGIPINFAGKYTIIEKSCGAMCVDLYLVDRVTGKIVKFPPEGDGKWGYRYHLNSQLLVANSQLLNDSMTRYLNQWEIEPEFYRWTGTEFKHLKISDY